jgi:photosystem II stability/assembly factor-like uncharacterized protein
VAVMRSWIFVVALFACGDDGGGDGGPLTDGNVTVAPVTFPYADGQATGVGFTPDDKLLAIVDGQLVSVADDGGAFTVINADPVHVAMAIAPDGTIYTSTGSEVRTYAPNATTPTIVDIDDGSVRFSFSPTGSVIASVITGDQNRTMRAYRSTDHGATWPRLALHDGSTSAVFAADVVYAPNGDILLSMSDSFHRSVDDGQSWMNFTPGARQSFACCLVGLANGDILHYGAGIGGLQRSTNGGMTWTELTLFNESPLWRQIIERADGTLLGIGNLGSGGGGVAIRAPGALFESTDGGATWTERITVNTHAVAAKGDRIALGLGSADQPKNYGGVFETFDDGTTWIPSGTTPIPPEDAQQITFDPDGQLMVIAHRALYRRTDAGWRALAYDALGLGGLAVIGDGTLVMVRNGFYFSTDNGRSWQSRDLQVTPFAGAGLSSIIETYTNDNLLLSYTDGNPNPAGILVRSNVTTDVEVPMPGAVLHMAQERGGTIYAQTFDVPSQRQHQSFDGGLSFMEMPTINPAEDYNSAGRYVARVQTQNDGIQVVLVSVTDEQLVLTLTGLPHAPYLINRVRFGPDDTLYILSGSGLFESTAPVR